MRRPCRLPALLLLAALSSLGGLGCLGLLGCRAEDDVAAGAWLRRDLWRERPTVEAYPFGDSSRRPFGRVISYLGTAEVRDLSRVSPQQLINIPKRTAAQVPALEQRAGSRLGWRVTVGPAAYVSFIPLGTPADRPPCACTFRMGLRAPDGAIHELSRLAVQPMGPIAQATVEVPLAAWEGQEIDLLLQVDGPALAPGQPVPTALWGSPALYERGPAPGRRRAAGRPNVLLIGFDTLRADALGPWGRTPSLTPAFDRLAGESDVWLDAYSTFNVTNPSFVSILTGLYGKDHGVYDLQTPLPRAHTTLAELFAAGGYDTMAVISARHLGDHNSGLGQGFAEVTTAGEHLSAELAVDTTMGWLAGRDRRAAKAAGSAAAASTGSDTAARPFFAWLHLFDPHTPHTPPEPYAVGFRPAEAAGLAPVAAWVPFRPPGPRTFDEPVLGGHRDLYDGEVAYLDRHLGRLLDFLASRGYLEDTVVVLVADHGENLGDHGILYRHLGLWDSTTHVPLLIRRPGARPAPPSRRQGLVQTLDLFPTLLRLAGLAGLGVPAQDGQDLYELTAEGSTGRRAVFAEHAGRLGLMVRTGSHLYTLSQGNNPRLVPDGPALYDLAADPAQAVNLAGQGQPAEREMDALLKRWLATRRQTPRPQPRTLSEEEEQRLKALGYTR